ncbi:unnamed protein product [Anisakis simplex]|uniref:Adenosine 3'-phospho 5'-phosphosulfate transporter 1 n=1 Tax=Anisakis simplex TaxID=6269 RepID=A0A0M3JWP5_ANISI|nr:unnamed protein product [Anisakis simplex]
MYLDALKEYWLFRFLFMLFGYGTVIVPMFLVIAIVRRKYKANELESPTLWNKWLISFAIGNREYDLITFGNTKRSNSVLQSKRNRFFDDSVRLFIYFISLQITLITMGFFQEGIMTKGYTLRSSSSQVHKFSDTQFLVFLNRISALILSASYLLFHRKREPVHVPPLYKHSFTSISNTLSSWCQYEALKYVSFPTQTVCKASKILPTMLLGFLVRGERYSKAACVSAVFISLGASLFFLSNQTHTSKHTEDGGISAVSGMCLMIGYLMFDAFTLNWQKRLFDTQPRVSKYQMMFLVNTFSMVLCLVSLIEQRTLFSSIHFAVSHKSFARDALMLSLSGACGQVVIYMTIERFGPIVFAVMMTVRQILSIALSAVAYSHPMSVSGVFGLFIVFAAIFSNIYRQYFNSGLSGAQRTVAI